MGMGWVWQGARAGAVQLARGEAWQARSARDGSHVVASVTVPYPSVVLID